MIIAEILHHVDTVTDEQSFIFFDNGEQIFSTRTREEMETAVFALFHFRNRPNLSPSRSIEESVKRSNEWLESLEEFDQDLMKIKCLGPTEDCLIRL